MLSAPAMPMAVASTPANQNCSLIITFKYAKCKLLHNKFQLNYSLECVCVCVCVCERERVNISLDLTK